MGLFVRSSPWALVSQKELGVTILKKVVYLGVLLGQGGKENRMGEESKLLKHVAEPGN